MAAVDRGGLPLQRGVQLTIEKGWDGQAQSHDGAVLEVATQEHPSML